MENRTPPKVMRTAKPTAPQRVGLIVSRNPVQTAQMSTSNGIQRPRVKAEAERFPLSNRCLACAVLESLKEKSYLMQPTPGVITMSMAMAVTDPDTGAQME